MKQIQTIKQVQVFRRKDACIDFPGGSDVGKSLDRYVREDNSETLGAGLFRVHRTQREWTLSYDEVLVCLEGTPRLTVGSELFELGVGDVIWLPKGTSITYDGENALMFYAVYPGNWRTLATAND